MTLEQYFQEAQRTLPDLGSEDKNIAHMIAGIVTEMGEVIDIYKKHMAYGKEIDREHLQEEFIDIVWYAANLASIWKMEVEQEVLDQFVVSESQHVQTISNFDNENIIAHLISGLCELTWPEISPGGIIAHVAVTMKALDLDFYEGLDKNIAKLKARFPDGFSEDKAINRD